jgi:hypothetical protein
MGNIVEHLVDLKMLVVMKEKYSDDFAVMKGSIQTVSIGNDDQEMQGARRRGSS